MAKDIDLLLLARPDHSYSIYKGLLKSNINFVYSSFKLMPKWLKRYVKNPRVRYYSRNYSNCRLLTLFHIYRVKYKKERLEKYEKVLYEFHLSKLFKQVNPRIIHYWPYLCLDKVRQYKANHPLVKTYADVYFPCEHWVIDNIFPVLSQYGLEEDPLTKRDAIKLKRVMEFEETFIVPSKFIEETYRHYYPDKHYIVIPYGMNKWDGYSKRKYKSQSEEIRKFVYAAGSVSIQKGCHYLLRYFKNHPELELHIYGIIPDSQRHLFLEYTSISNIIFHGLIPKSMMSETMASYDVGIHLSLYDAYSLAVGEMMGAGLPVVVSNRTGICSLVKDIGAGVVTNLDDSSIDNSISEILKPEYYNKCVDNLDDYMRKSPQYYEDEIVEFYKKQLSE